MINSTLKRAVAVAILAGASVGAHATTTNLGAISNTDPTGFAGAVLGTGQSFSDLFSFSFLGQSPDGVHVDVKDVPTTVGSSVTFNGILSAVSLFSAGANGVVGGGDDSLLASGITGDGGHTVSFDYSQPLSGSSYITVSGISNGSSGAIFAGQIQPIP